MAAAALLRSATRRSRMTMVTRAVAGVLRRRPDLLWSRRPSWRHQRAKNPLPGSPTKNPLPGGKNKELSASSRDKEIPVCELERKIVKKQGELLSLRLQMDVARGSSLSGSDKSLEDKEQLLRLLRVFQAETQREPTKGDAVLAGFATTLVIVSILGYVTLLAMD